LGLEEQSNDLRHEDWDDVTEDQESDRQVLHRQTEEGTRTQQRSTDACGDWGTWTNLSLKVTGNVQFQYPRKVHKVKRKTVETDNSDFLLRIKLCDFSAVHYENVTETFPFRKLSFWRTTFVKSGKI
jgi:hypothetical protein